MLEFLAQSQQNANPLVTFLPLILIGAAFYFVLIRPQQRRAKAQQALLRSVEVGDEVITTAGVYGTIVDIDEDTDDITLEIAPNTQIRMVRAGIARRIVEDEYDEYEDEEDDDSSASPDEQPGPFTSS